MFESKKVPGKKFGSIFAGRKFDADHTEDGMHSEGKPEDKAMPEMNEEQPEEKMGEENNVDGAQVASEHGPAHKVEITHEEGKHTVQSHHPDGHMHTSVHDKGNKAHDHARKLAAMEAAEEDKEQPAQKAEPESDNFQMPELG